MYFDWTVETLIRLTINFLGFVCLTTDIWGCTGCVCHGTVHCTSTGQGVTDLSTAFTLPIAPAIRGVSFPAHVPDTVVLADGHHLFCVLRGPGAALIP